MEASNDSKALSQFRRNPWPFQTTFETPLNDLERFVSVFFSVHQPIESGCVTIDDYVFEPKTLNAFLAKQSVSERITHGVSLKAEGQQEVETLLCATLADWIDFLFIPSPKRFAIYADHDEYITFYANTKGNLSKIVSILLEKGFKKVDDWERG
ncbi:MAG: hypothetical protein KF693_09475 [Nitrospira sp.]|nr:hypothetical protein [Nitrospira sp.]